MTSRSNNASLPSTAHSLTWPPPARNGSANGSTNVVRQFVNYASLPAHGPGQTVNGWASVPEGIVEMFEVIDDAFIAAASSAADPRDQDYWLQRMEEFRAQRQRFDAANPARSVPLVPR